MEDVYADLNVAKNVNSVIKTELVQYDFGTWKRTGDSLEGTLVTTE